MAAPVLHWFWSLKAAAPSGWGPSTITFEAIYAWSKLLNIRPLPWQVRAIRAMDNTFNEAVQKKKG